MPDPRKLLRIIKKSFSVISSKSPNFTIRKFPSTPPPFSPILSHSHFSVANGIYKCSRMKSQNALID